MDRWSKLTARSGMELVSRSIGDAPLAIARSLSGGSEVSRSSRACWDTSNMVAEGEGIVSEGVNWVCDEVVDEPSEARYCCCGAIL